MTGLGMLFIQVLALWLIGSAMAMGLVISRRNRSDEWAWPGYVWALVFSWAFVGWFAGEMIALAFKAAADIQSSVSTDNSDRLEGQND